MENIPRSTQCVQQHLSPSAQFFTDEERTEASQRVAFVATTPEQAFVTEAEWARSDALLVAMETERALAERISGPCGRCGCQSSDLIEYCGDGICGGCAHDIGEVA